jgi:hypothetical protein
MRTLAFLLTAFALAFAGPAVAAETKTPATMYKSPYCDCCEGHAAYLDKRGYQVTIVATEELPALRRRHGVPESLEGCHMILVGGYVVEGHVSATVIDRLLRQKPKIVGVSMPGMPAGVPGMGGKKEGPIAIYEIGPDTPKVYATE